MSLLNAEMNALRQKRPEPSADPGLFNILSGFTPERKR